MSISVRSAAAAIRAASASRALTRATHRFGRVMFVFLAVASSGALVAARAGGRETDRAAVVRARAAPVTLVEVDSQVDSKRTSLPNVTTVLRRELEQKLAAIDWSKTGIVRKYTVSASLVRLESVKGKDALSASCIVSATVRDAERGNLLAIVEGKARAEDAPFAAAVAERGALEAAASSAIRALPEAIRRLQ